MSNIRVFVSFDIDHDRDLRDRLAKESGRGGASFLLFAGSEPGEVSEKWSEAARKRIGDADRVIVVCGEHTAESAQVNEELRIAQEEDKPYFLLWGRRERMCTMPARATRSESMYSWTPEVLQQQLSASLQNTQPRGVAARKRT